MKFSWTCTTCKFSTIKCYESKCQREQLLLKVQEAKDLVFAGQRSTRSTHFDRQQAEATFSEISTTMNGHFDELSERLETNRLSAEKDARALKRYIIRASNSFQEEGKSTGRHDLKIFLEKLRTETRKISAVYSESVTADDM